MLSLLPSFFQPSSSQTLTSLKKLGNGTTDGLFAFDQGNPDCVKLIVQTGDYLIQYENQSRHKICRIAHLTFQTRFLMLVDVKIIVTQQNGKWKGIKFDKDGCESQCLYSQRQDLLALWNNALGKKINKRGFHDLFKPIKKIGKGNFASVYLAETKIDGRMVAVKAFNRQATFSQDKGKECLINEINLLRRMNHESILKLHEVYQSQNSIYMILELLQGGQLYDKIQSKYKFSSTEVKKLMASLLKGIQHMSQHRIMHRDLKPQNIIIRGKESLELVIADFGLATWADESEYLFVRCGTPGYVAPEIINIKDMKTKSEPICDMFSAGLIFHIILLGKSIFPGKNYSDVLAQNRACDFTFDSKLYSDVPPETLFLLRRMLDKNPTTRIKPQEALSHNYFAKTRTQTEEPMLRQVSLKYLNTPLMRKNSHAGNQAGPSSKFPLSKLHPSLNQKVQNYRCGSKLRENHARLSVAKSRGKNKENVR